MIARLAGPVLVAVAGAVTLHWSWLTWPDVFIDFGRELYVAWRLAEGQTLYKDIAYFNGPLSPYVNSLWFRLFGTSLLTLAVCNIVLLAGFVGLLYRMLSEIADRFAATAACLTFVTIFAFGQFVTVGNYNFVCPYSHELTHGVVLAFLSLLCLWLHHRRGKLRYAAAAAAALGLVFLTKVEVFVAAAVAAGGYLVFMLYLERPTPWRVVKLLATFLGCAGVPPVLAFAFLCLALPASQALAGTLGSWSSVFNKELSSLRFYHGGMGLDDPASNIKTMLVWTGRYLTVVGPTAALGLLLRKPGRLRAGAAAACFLIVGAVIAARWETIAWFDAVRPLPLIMLALAASFAVRLMMRRRRLQGSAQPVLASSMILLALVLLAKIILNVRVFHYGFVLAMPATLLLVVTLVTWLPALINTLGGYGGTVRAATAALLVVAITGHLRYVDARFQRKTHRVAEEADTIKAGVRGLAAQAILTEIDRRVAPDQTLVVLPEGVMLNYLTRRVNPTPYINFMPPELIMFGEEAILNSFRENPPDFIAVVHKDTSEYGFRYFGRDYGQRILDWTKRNYHPVKLIGAPPLQDERFGMLLLKLRDPPSSAEAGRP